MINYIRQKLLEIGKGLLKENQVLIVSGGFEEQGVVKSAVKDKLETIAASRNNHIEGDTLVYLHAVKTEYNNVLIYSPDSDFFIGLHIAEKYKMKNLTIQLKDIGYEKDYFNLSSFCNVIKENIQLNTIQAADISSTIQSLFICTGCDYISFFRYHSKLIFFATFFKYAQFICGEQDVLQSGLKDLHCSDDKNGLSFYRFIGCEYMKGLFSAFDTNITSPVDLYTKFTTEENSLLQNHQEWLARIRKAYLHGNISEEMCLVSSDALQLHWSRSSYVSRVWRQADCSFIEYPDLTSHGWQIENSSLSIIWDSKRTQDELNIFLEMMLNGCSCSSPNINKLCSGRCGCKRKGIGCRQACRCQAKCNNAPADPSPESIFQEVMNYYRRVSGTNESQNLAVENDPLTFEDVEEEISLALHHEIVRILKILMLNNH